MKAVTLSILACAALGAAQLGSLPDCAKPCANSLPPECNLNVGCICKSQSFISSISCCVKTKCSDADQQKTQQVAQQLCDTAQVTLPTAASCPASAGATQASSTVMPSSSTAGVAGAATTGMSASSNGTMAGSSNSTGSSTGAGTAASGASTGGSSTTGSSSGSATSSAAAKATSNAAAGLQALGSGIVVAGAAVAAFAFL